MMTWVRAVVVAALVATAVSAGDGVGLRAVLTHELAFSADDLDALARGRIVKHALESADDREMAIVGAVRIDTTAAAFVDRFRDIVRFKSSPDVLEVGRFGNPPRVADLARLTISKTDLDLHDCRVGDCDIRLPAAAIRRFQTEIDWHAPDAHERAAALFKQLLVDDVLAHERGGPGLISQYDDGKAPIFAGRDFAAVVAASSFLGELVPGLPAHLTRVPPAPLPDTDDFYYWSKEKFGFTPYISVTHVTIARTAWAAYVITSKGVYASRYFDASLGLTIAADADADEGGGFYLVYLNRSRAHALKGLFSGLRRMIVERRGKASLEENLRVLKSRLERAES